MPSVFDLPVCQIFGNQPVQLKESKVVYHTNTIPLWPEGIRPSAVTSEHRYVLTFLMWSLGSRTEEPYAAAAHAPQRFAFHLQRLACARSGGHLIITMCSAKSRYLQRLPRAEIKQWHFSRIKVAAYHYCIPYTIPVPKESTIGQIPV